MPDEKSKDVWENLRSRLAIDRHMIIAKVAFMFYFASYGSFFTFNTTFLTDVGLSAKQAGFINGIRAIPMVIGNITWCIVADRTKQHRIIVTALVVLVTALVLPVPWIAQKINNEEIKNGRTLNMSAMSKVDIYATKYNVTIHLNGTHHDLVQSNDTLYKTMLGMNLVAGFFYGPLISLCDHVVTDRVHSAPTRTFLSDQIRFASLGWAIFPFMAGALANYAPIGDVSPYVWVFIIYAICLWVYLMSMINLYAPSKQEDPRENVRLKLSENGNHMEPCGRQKNAFNNRQERCSLVNKLKDENEVCLGDYKGDNEQDVDPNNDSNKEFISTLVHLMTNPHIIFFYTTLLVLATGVGMQGGFLLIFLKHLGASGLILGLTTIFDQGGEFFLCPLVDVIVRRVGGDMRGLIASFAFCIIRSLLVSFLHDPWFVLPYLLATTLFQPLLVTCGLKLTMRMAPENVRTTVFSFFDITYSSGLLIGSSIGGLVYDKFGGRGLFRGACILMSFWAIVLLTYTLIFKRDKIDEIRNKIEARQRSTNDRCNIFEVPDEIS